MVWRSYREAIAENARGLSDHLVLCGERYQENTRALEKLGDKADLVASAAIASSADAKAAAVQAATEAKAAVSDLERRLQKWLIALLLAVLSTALTSMIHIPAIHFGP